MEGYVLFSMPLDVVLSIVAVITKEESSALDDVAQAAVIGLMDTIRISRFRSLLPLGTVELRVALRESPGSG